MKEYRLAHRRSVNDVKYHTKADLAKIKHNISNSVAGMNQELEALRNEFKEEAKKRSKPEVNE